MAHAQEHHAAKCLAALLVGLSIHYQQPVSLPEEEENIIMPRAARASTSTAAAGKDKRIISIRALLSLLPAVPIAFAPRNAHVQIMTVKEMAVIGQGDGGGASPPATESAECKNKSAK